MSDEGGRRDIVIIYCAHGVQGERGDFVQRFRWAADQSAWIASDTSGEKVTTIGGVADAPRPLTPEAIADALPQGRQHFNVYCPDCGRKVPMTYGGAQWALTKLSEAGFTSPSLAALRRVYEGLPKQLR